MSGKQGEDYRKKKRAKIERNSPFPVPISSITRSSCDENYWYHFTGRLQNNSVIVPHSGDIRYLYKMGFFGRGMLSRGGPEFHQTIPYVYLAAEKESEPNIVNVMKRKMYLRHRQWQQLARQDGKIDPDQIAAEDQEYDSDVEYYQDQDCQNEPMYEEENADMYLTSNEPEVFESNVAKNCSSPLCSSSIKEDRTFTSWNNSEGDVEFWTSEVNNTDHNSQNEKAVSEQGDNKYKINSDCDNRAESMLDTENVKAVIDWDNSEADEDFWATPSVPSATDNTNYNDRVKSDLDESTEGQMSSDNGEQPVAKKRRVQEDNAPYLIEYNDKLTTSTVDNHDVTRIKGDNDASSLNESEFCNVGKSEIVKNSLTRHSKASVSPDRISLDNDPNKVSHMNLGSENSSSKLDSLVTKHFEVCNSLNSRTDNSKQSVKETTVINNSQIPCDTNIDKHASNTETEHGNIDVTSDNTHKTIIDDTHIDVNDEDQKETGESEKAEIHPYCESDDKDADYLVIDDFHEGHVTKRSYQWQPAMKKDPFPFTEPLILTAEEVNKYDLPCKKGLFGNLATYLEKKIETNQRSIRISISKMNTYGKAFFLSYGLGCLTVKDENHDKPLTLKELWVTFCQQKRFLPCYAAYHYFRSRGWVPKSGILFGTDFLLYKEGPPFFHGSYSVVVRAVYSGTYQSVEKYSNRSLSWTTFSGLQRITEHVAKTMLVCYVIIPSDFTEEENSSPKCLSRLKIHLQKYSRWVSSQEREAEKLTDMP